MDVLYTFDTSFFPTQILFLPRYSFPLAVTPGGFLVYLRSREYRTKKVLGFRVGISLLLLLGVEILLQLDAKFLTEGLKLIEVLLVLARGLDLGLDSCD